jgi:hypothetical protein
MTIEESITAGISVGGPGGLVDSVVIGGTKPANARSGVATDLRMQTPTENKAGILEATVLSEIPTGTTVSLLINGALAFTGSVRKSEPGVGDRQRITAYDVRHELKQTFVDLSFQDARPFAVVNELAGASGLPLDFEPPTDADAGRIRITRSFTDERADSVLGAIEKSTGTQSVVTADGTLRIAPVGDLRDGGGESLTRIIDVAAGSRQPPFQSVQVIGNTAVDDPPLKGERVRHLLSAQPVIAEAGSGQPTFIFEDDGISSQAEATTIAESLLSRLQKQQQGGFVSVVGRPEIRPFDIVELPAAQGGGNFLVDSIEHRLSSSSGFISRLSLAAPI